MIWCFGQTAQFLFLLARAAPAFLPTALSVSLRPLFLLWQAQYAQVFRLKPAPFCTLFAGLGSTNKSAISLLLLSDSRSVFSSIFPFISNSVAALSGTAFSFFLFYQAAMGLRHPFLPGNDAADELTRRERCLRPLQFLVVPLHLSLVPTLVLSRNGDVLSHQNSLTHRFPRFPPRNLCSFVTLAVSSLVFAATDTAFF